MDCNAVAFGGGLNSTALLIQLVRQKAKIDLVLFADTGAEKPETYCHLKMMNEWLSKHCYPKIIIVKKTDKDGNILTLEQNCLENAMLPSLAYGFKTCSHKFKINPQEKYINNYQLALETWKRGKKVRKYIGYDADEGHRVKDYESKKYENIYPLVDMGSGREACKEIVKSEGLSIPSKSSCFFCPAMKKMEIRELKQKHPALMKRALKLESNAMNNLQSIKGLGRYFSWKDFLKQGELFPKLFPNTNIELACGCYDG